MKISLVVGSLYRKEFINRLLGSLATQRHTDFEVIIVEQSNPQAVRSDAELFSSLEVKVLSSARGLSRARNIGMEAARGEIVGFPDDDCWYLPGTLLRVAHQFERDAALDILCGRVLTPAGPMIGFPRAACEITRSNVWRTVVSPGLFVRRSSAEAIGDFDQWLGVGSGTLAGSGEETDFVMRGLSLGMRTMYDSLLHVSHPSPLDVKDRLNPDVGYKYGYGMGHLLRKHHYSVLYAAASIARVGIGSVMATTGRDTALGAFRESVARGRLHGYLNTEIGTTR